MKKFINIIISVSIILSMFLSQGLVTSALEAPLYRGDTDLDGKISIIDATIIQKYLVDLENLSKRQLYVADVDDDGSVDINDVTLIQKYLVGLVESFDGANAYLHKVSIKNFYANYDSNKAMAGTPVTFTAEATGGVEPFSYEFLINGEIVQERSEANNFTYTFVQAGNYEIEVKYYNSFDEYETYNTQYIVVEPYETEKPIISAIYMNKLSVCDHDKRTIVTVNAIGGDSPYEYRFSLDDGTIVQDFSNDNEFLIVSELSQGEHIVTIEVKDVSGNTIKENYTINVVEALA